jgi:hypothetical protein
VLINIDLNLRNLRDVIIRSSLYKNNLLYQNNFICIAILKCLKNGNLEREFYILMTFVTIKNY